MSPSLGREWQPSSRNTVCPAYVLGCGTLGIDLAGPERRGLAMGLNEFAGYGAVALAALATGYVAAAYGLRPEPFYLGVVFAVAGLGLSFFAVRETLQPLEAR